MAIDGLYVNNGFTNVNCYCFINDDLVLRPSITKAYEGRLEADRTFEVAVGLFIGGPVLYVEKPDDIQYASKTLRITLSGKQFVLTSEITGSKETGYEFVSVLRDASSYLPDAYLGRSIWSAGFGQYLTSYVSMYIDKHGQLKCKMNRTVYDPLEPDFTDWVSTKYSFTSREFYESGGLQISLSGEYNDMITGIRVCPRAN